MICPQCGTSLPDNSPYCSVCGRALIPATSLSAPPQDATTSAAQPPKTSGKAIASLILGVLPLSIFSSLPAVVLGHVALSEIKKSSGGLTGKGLAIAGLVLGYLGIAMAVVMIPLMLAIAIPNLLRARIAANEASAVSSLRTINIAQIAYHSTYTEAGYAPDLRTLGSAGASCGAPSQSHACLIGETLASASARPGKAGYVFSLQVAANGTQYLATAIPARPHETGVRSFCSVEDGVIHLNSSGGDISDRAACAALPSLD